VHLRRRAGPRSTATMRQVSRAARSVLGSITYPVRPPAGFQNGRIVTAGHWDKIGAIFAREPWVGDSAKLVDEESSHMVHIADARENSRPLSLVNNGFELREHKSMVSDFYDDREITTRYYSEVSELVMAATGATDVFVFQHMRRDSAALNKESDKERNQASAPGHGAVQRVHADYTPDNGPLKLRELEETGIIQEGAADGRRWSIINVWRNMDASEPITALPLAVLDAATVRAEETFTYALVVEGDEPLVGFNNGVSHSEAHDWYYYPGMTRDEALLFYTFDGQCSPPRFVFHTAFHNDAAPPNAPPRRSIECRCLALF